MSTLYDALKKAENKNDSQPPRKNNKSALFLVLLAIGFLAISFTIKVIKTKKLQNKESKKKEAKKPVLAKGATTTKGAPIIEKKTYVGYVLEGIIYNEEASLVVINGKILRKNEKIDNLVVTNITPNKVELLNLKDNTILSLNL